MTPGGNLLNGDEMFDVLNTRALHLQGTVSVRLKPRCLLPYNFLTMASYSHPVPLATLQRPCTQRNKRTTGLAHFLECITKKSDVV